MALQYSLLSRQRKKNTIDAGLLNAKMHFFLQLFDSVREKDFNVHFSTRIRKYIQSIESDCRSRGCELAPDLVPYFCGI